MKITFLFFTLTILVIPCYSQNCQLSSEQQNLVSQAKAAIREATNKPSYDTYIDLVTKCSKALDEIPYCPDIYNFYREVIDTYSNLHNCPIF